MQKRLDVRELDEDCEIEARERNLSSIGTIPDRCEKTRAFVKKRIN